MSTYPETYRLRPGMWGWSDTCEALGEHKGNEYRKDDAHGRWTQWDCCDARDFVGELFDCDTCLEPGVVPTGAAMPAGWIEDTNGHHCPRCQP